MPWTPCTWRQAASTGPAVISGGCHDRGGHGPLAADGLAYVVAGCTRSRPQRFEPVTALITPPNQATHIELKWSFGDALLDQSDATDPGTTISQLMGS